MESQIEQVFVPDLKTINTNTMKTINAHIILSLSLILIVGSLYGQEPSDCIVHLNTSVTENPAAISFTWDAIAGDSIISVYRKSKDAANWGDAIAVLQPDAKEYTDNNVKEGVEYEYKIIKKRDALIGKTLIFVMAGIRCKEIEYRGKIIMLVDSSFVDSLRSELRRFETDLIGDGWDILRKDISRNASVKYVKSIIMDFYNSDTFNVKAVLLFGHIPVPYSGCETYDGHIEHFGAWPADIYYGDMNEKIWTDENSSCTVAIRSENINIPGDGKFDVTTLPPDETISLQVGRIDLYNLPIFHQSESELYKNYLNKNYNFRHKINDPKSQALIDDNFGWHNGFPVALSGWGNLIPLVNSFHVKPGDYFPDMKKDSYIWSYGCGGGGLTSCNGVGNSVDFVNYSPKTVFTGLWGSMFGDWDNQNNFMRSALASKGWILTSVWAGVPHYNFHQMGMGETIGYCIRASQNDLGTYDDWSNRCAHVSMLGDPTLRMHIVCPVNSLQSAITTNNRVLLAWKPADDSIIGYCVYKLDTLTKKYEKITNSPVKDTWFEDSLPNPGSNYYMLKSLKLTRSASGTYYNLSQGVFDTINYTAQTPVPVTGIELLLDSENIFPLKVYEPFSVNAHIIPENATNRLMKWSILNATADGKFDVKGDVLSDRGGILTVIAEALDGSGVTDSLEVLIDSIPETAGPITGDTELCRGRRGHLYTVPEIRGSTAYIWTLPNGTIDTTILNEYSLTIDSTIVGDVIKVKGSNPYCAGEESTLNLTIYEVPPRPTISLNNGVLYSDAPEGNQWYKDGIAIEGAIEQTYTPTDAANYFVKVTLNGCTSVASNPERYPPVGLETERFSTQVHIYPNPATGELTIEFEKQQTTGTTIELFDISGKVVYTTTINPGETQHQINLSSFEEGLYFIRISNTDYTVTKKVIKVE
jgi:hypothetical protein